MKKIVLLLFCVAFSYALDFDSLDKQIFETAADWDIKISDPVMLVSKKVTLPSEVTIEPSNNCLGWIKH